MHNKDGYKKCKICEQVKSLKKFQTRGKGKGFTSRCRLCMGQKIEVTAELLNLIKKININDIYIADSNKETRIIVSKQELINMYENYLKRLTTEKVYLHYKSFKDIVLIRDSYLCHYCGKSGNSLDHKIPASKGGETSLDNCVCACQVCNEEKGDSEIKN